MGCAAVSGAKQSPSSDSGAVTAESVSDPGVVSSTWATKKQSAPSSGEATPNSSSLNSPANNNGKNLIMSDADDDDEIEIIYESAPKLAQKRQEPQIVNGYPAPTNLAANPAANGQEPPQTVEVDTRPKKAEKPQEPLSRKQQDEAAALAERRKKFDNQRYHQGGESEKPLTMFRPMDANQALVQQNSATPSQPAPTTDTIMGLNSPMHSKVKDYNSQNDSFCGLPGGIIDDDLPPAQVVNPNKKKKSHDDVDSRGFDADDERIMTEILEDFDI